MMLPPRCDRLMVRLLLLAVDLCCDAHRRREVLCVNHPRVFGIQLGEPGKCLGAEIIRVDGCIIGAPRLHHGCVFFRVRRVRHRAHVNEVEVFERADGRDCIARIILLVYRLPIFTGIAVDGESKRALRNVAALDARVNIAMLLRVSVELAPEFEPALIFRNVKRAVAAPPENHVFVMVEKAFHIIAPL